MGMAQGMRHASGHVKPLIGSWRVDGTGHFECCDAIQHVKELLCLVVQMPNLGRTTRHPLLNHAESWACGKMPAITIATPEVMLASLF